MLCRLDIWGSAGVHDQRSVWNVGWWCLQQLLPNYGHWALDVAAGREAKPTISKPGFLFFLILNSHSCSPPVELAWRISGKSYPPKVSGTHQRHRWSPRFVAIFFRWGHGGDHKLDNRHCSHQPVTPGMITSATVTAGQVIPRIRMVGPGRISLNDHPSPARFCIAKHRKTREESVRILYGFETRERLWFPKPELVVTSGWSPGVHHTFTMDFTDFTDFSGFFSPYFLVDWQSRYMAAAKYGVGQKNQVFDVFNPHVIGSCSFGVSCYISTINPSCQSSASGDLD